MRGILPRPLRHAVVAAVLAVTATAALAIEYRSVSAPSILYDTPSDKGKRLYIVAAGTPVEVVVTLDKWVKVRDAGGTLSWIESGALSDKRTLQVTATRAVVRQRADEASPPVFEVAKDVILEEVEAPANGWIKVRHRDGAQGYLRISEVWGF